MPIEFRCTQCGKLLRTGDDTAGKQAKCPECGAVMTIPLPGQEAPQSPQPAAGGAPPPGPFAYAPASQAPDPQNPYQSPAGLGPDPGAFAAPGEIRPTRIDFGETLSRTFTIFSSRWLPVLGGILLMVLIAMPVSLLLQGILEVVGRSPATVFLVQVVSQVFGLWLGIGIQMFLLGVVRGEEPRFGLLFSGGPFLLPIILCAILVTLIVGLGFLLLIIPGIIFALMLVQSQLLIIDRNMGVLDAMSMSREVMVGNKLTVFAIWLVTVIVGLLLTLVTCGLGYFAVVPYWAILTIVIYFGVTGQPTLAERERMSQQYGGAYGGQPAPGMPPQTPPGDSPFAS